MQKPVRQPRIMEMSSSSVLLSSAQFLADITCFVLLLYCFFKKTQYQKLSMRFELNVKTAKQVVHDVRSPLSALDIIIKRLPELHETKCMLARDAIAHIRDITDNLEKNNSAENAGDFSLVQIAALLDYAISERRAALEAQPIKINRDFSADAYDLFVRAIPHEVKCILINIINNACEALSSHAGTVTASLSRINNNAIVIISDDGVGFSKQAISMHFTRGFTTKLQGSGLGLSHAKEHIERWGGSITLRANEIQGASVIMSLPIQR